MKATNALTPDLEKKLDDAGSILDFFCAEDSDGTVEAVADLLEHGFGLYFEELNNSRKAYFESQNRDWEEDVYLPSEIFDRAVFLATPYAILSQEEFYGTDFFDLNRGLLIEHGHVSPSHHETHFLTEPFCYEDLPLIFFEEKRRGAGGMGLGPETTPLGLGYAFLCPAYDLGGSPKAKQALFDQLRAECFPQHEDIVIRSWSCFGTGLLDVSSYFVGGSDWWGCFLYSYYDPQTRRLTVIVASDTD